MKNLLILLVITSFNLSAAQPKVSKILFGSCAHQDDTIEILKTINSEHPELFIFLGDNIYGDTEDMQTLTNKYKKIGANPHFKALKQNTPIIATWDDHDFGENDAGKEYPQKEASKDIMLDFWGEPKSSKRRFQKDGIYTSYMYGEGKERIHVILLDLRFNRDAINSVSNWRYLTERKPKNMGPYSPHEDLKASMLGKSQWKWLEEELKKPAALKIIGSSLQLIPEFSGWEAWANYPGDKTKLLGLIQQHKVNGVMIMSGDTHWGEISKFDEAMPYPLWEVTSSGLTEEWKDVSPNKHRYGQYSNKVNYGFLEVDWDQVDPVIKFGLRNISGNTINSIELALSEISPF